MASLYEQKIAQDNSTKSPEDAAQYVHDQNQSSYVSDYEAKVAADALQKFSFSSDDAKRLYKKWVQISNLKCPGLTIASNFPESKAQKDRANSWGKVIYELATGRFASGLSYANDSSIPSAQRKFTAQTVSVMERENKEKPVEYDPAIAKQLDSLANYASAALTSAIGSKSAAENYKRMFVNADDVLIRKVNKNKDKAGSLDRGAVVFFVKPSTEHPGYSEILVGESGKFNNYLISSKYIGDTAPAVKKLPSQNPKPPSSKSIDAPQKDQIMPIADKGFPVVNVIIGIAAAALAFFAVKQIVKKD